MSSVLYRLLDIRISHVTLQGYIQHGCVLGDQVTRPHAVAHDKYYTRLINNYEIRQHVKPGITGWAQVNGLRGETTSPELMRKRVEHDIWYAKNASITLDIKSLLLTVVEVFRQRNAH
jgi:undecaprenyl-phosphate galactose phosphotransferase/putative colanic acid biosynthesis UDP-glucose lipid carrier transferase